MHCSQLNHKGAPEHERNYGLIFHITYSVHPKKYAYVTVFVVCGCAARVHLPYGQIYPKYPQTDIVTITIL